MGTSSEVIVGEAATWGGIPEWVRWIAGILGSALVTTACGAWYISATLAGINNHLRQLDDGQQRLDSGQAAIMEQHQVLSDQIYTMDQRAMIIDTFLHDQFPERIPLPNPGIHDGFQHK